MKGSGDPSQAVQRVRVGMIGLAVVVLLIGLASAIMRTASREAPIAAIGAPKADVVANMAAPAATANVQQELTEPLAELGVPSATGNGQATAPRAAQ